MPRHAGVVGVGLAQVGGVRADRAVDVEVAAEAGGAVQRDEGAGLLGVGDRLGPVADGARQVGAAPELEDVGEVVRPR